VTPSQSRQPQTSSTAGEAIQISIKLNLSIDEFISFVACVDLALSLPRLLGVCPRIQMEGQKFETFGIEPLS
jgi:hypothetical protein